MPSLLLTANFLTTKKKEMANKIKVLFWLRRTKINNRGLAPLMLRLSFQNKRVDKATGYFVNPDQWNSTKQYLKGNNEKAKELNEWVNQCVVKISSLYNDDVEKGARVNLLVKFQVLQPL